MTENWDFYFCQVDGAAASIFVNLGIAGEAPVGNLEELTWLRLHMREPREDGLSSQAEFPKLTEIEDCLNEAIGAAEADIEFVGRITTGGCRDFFFYTDNGLQAESSLSAALVPYHDYEFEIGTRDDAEWETYFEFLHPSEREYQTIMTSRVLSHLEEGGDVPEIERDVSHWAYFPSGKQRDRFCTAATARGYKITDRSDPDDEDSDYFGVQLTSHHAADFATLNDVVLDLYDLALEHGGEYDGWETSVERGDTDGDTSDDTA